MQRPRRESVLATILFTDIVGSSHLVAELGEGRGANGIAVGQGGVWVTVDGG
jgi:class 3 adenylate cyclase